MSLFMWNGWQQAPLSLSILLRMLTVSWITYFQLSIHCYVVLSYAFSFGLEYWVLPSVDNVWCKGRTPSNICGQITHALLHILIMKYMKRTINVFINMLYGPEVHRNILLRASNSCNLPFQLSRLLQDFCSYCAHYQVHPFSYSSALHTSLYLLNRSSSRAFFTSCQLPPLFYHSFFFFEVIYWFYWWWRPFDLKGKNC